MTFGKPAESPCENCGVTVQQKEGPGRQKRFCRPWCGVLYRNRYSDYLNPLGR